MPRVAVLMATAFERDALLASRSLPSVYGQRNVDARRIQVFIVDDNVDSRHVDATASLVERLRRERRLHVDEFATFVIGNCRTRGYSGTGAWNTGIGRIAEHFDGDDWVAFLDDDDEYAPEHLARCASLIDDDVVGIFERLEWVRASGVESRPFTHDDLTAEAFFVGNPGVQGSNLFVRLDALRAVGGFDESLPNTTDRDFMIRFLRYVRSTRARILALPTVGVRYFDHDLPRVNTDLERKHAGLDRFYKKFAGEFTEDQRRASFVRAQALFGYVRATK